MMRKHPGFGLTPDGRGNPDQEEKAIRAFTAGNADVLKSAGIEPTGGNLYAAHFLGAGGRATCFRSRTMPPWRRLSAATWCAPTLPAGHVGW